MSDGFSVAIRNERKRLAMSVRCFAEHLGTSTATVKRWEAATAVPSCAQREAILDTIQHGAKPVPGLWQCHPGWWLRVARQRRCLSIRSAARVSGTSPSSWQRYESGHVPIAQRQAMQLADMLGEPLPNFHLNHAISFADGLARAEREVAGEPSIACAILIQLLLNAKSGRLGIPDENRQQFAAAAHVLLARAVMQIGDHDLAGQIYRAVLRVGAPKGELLPNEFAIRASTAWIGYPHIKATRFATRRLSWLNRQLEGLSLEARAEFSIMRAMFADWAGHPDVALSFLGEGAATDNGATMGLIQLAEAWVHATHGDPNRALALSEPWLPDPNCQLAFVANKVAFEAHYQTNQVRKATEHYSVLESMRLEHGLWAPDLLARGRKIRENTDQPR